MLLSVRVKNDMQAYLWIIIPGVFILASVVVIVVIIARRLPHTRILRTEMMQKERQARVKLQLIEKRLERKARDAQSVVWKTVQPVWRQGVSAARRLYDKILEIEKSYQEEIEKEKREKIHQKASSDSPHQARLKEQEYIDEGKRLLEEGSLEQAERKFIDAIAVNPRSLESYTLLGQLYEEQEEFQQAEEVYRYVVKLTPANPAVHASLARVLRRRGRLQEAAEIFRLAADIAENDASYFFSCGECWQEIGDHEQACELFMKARECEPSNPRYLDACIDEAIRCGNRLLAQDAFDTLKNVNPENKKLEEFKQRIDQMGGSVVPQKKKKRESKR